MKRLMIVSVIALFFPLSGLAQGLPRYALKPGMTLGQSIAKAGRDFNRVAGVSGTRCWVYDGNAKVGWRHAACVGNYNYAGTTYRFKMTSTPASCSREKITFVVPGVQREVRTQAWKHRTFNCKR